MFKTANFIFLFLATAIFAGTFVLPVQGAKHTLEDFGLSAEAVKYLSTQEIQDILNSKTPAETMAEKRAQIEKSGTPEEKAVLNNPQLANSGFLKDVVDCFDYYHFGSVQTNITAQSFNFNPGDVINFKGPITNQNDYPIIDGTLYVKIFRSRSATKEPNGPDVVDQFVAVDNITIPAKGNIPVSFSWKVPSSLSGGDYKIASFFIVAKRFNLLGLSFTDDVIGNAFSFQVSGEKTNVQFDKAGVTINNNSYFFAVYPLRIPSKDPAVISAKIDNSTNSNEAVNIVWKLYKWDSIGTANLIRTVSAISTIKANSSNKIQITVPEADEPVYYLVGELTYKDSKSIIGIRFVRPEVDKTRLNFPSIMSFPIKQGATSTMFSCVYNSGTSQSVPNGKLILKLTDSSGKTVDEYTYQGPVTGEMMGVKKDFISKNSLDHFFLTAQLWQSDKLVDESTSEYDCNKIDPTSCNPKSNLIIFISLGIIVLLAICGGTIIFFKRKK
jgi:hypothetical protein